VNAVESVLSALADSTRRELLERLSVHGYATATTLADELPITRQAVVQHLAVLDAAGLVSGRREGREHRFAVRTERITETARWMDVLAQQWDHRLAAIRRIAETEVDDSAQNPADARH
jgi:DNA-binding transcriptional ArsR family regulator